MTLRQAALWYAEHGIPVFPCRPGGKEPLCEHGFKDATTSRQQIEQWWSETPAANIGIPTGTPSGWLLFDCDPRHNGDDTLDSLISKYGRWPNTAEAITGGDGRHVIFKHVDGLKCGEIAPGLDIKTTGGYLIAAPSIHPSGKAYQWDGVDGAAACLKLCEPPGWLIRLARERGRADGPATNGAGKIREGGRHKALVSYAGKLRRSGCSPDEILAALMNFNQQHCEPAKSPEEIQKIAGDIGKRYEPSQSGPRILSGDDCSAVLREELMPMEWLIEDMLPKGLYLLADREKGGKTYLAMQIALAVALARPVFPNSERFAAKKRGKVHYFDLEMDKATFQERLHFLDAEALAPGAMSRVNELSRITDTGIIELREFLNRQPADLLVIDTLAAATRGGGGKRQDVFNSEYEELSGLRDLAHERDITILLTHHTNKALAAENVFDAISGTRARGAATDGNFVISRPKGVVTLNGVGRRLSGLEIAIQLFRDDTPGWSLLGDPAAAQRSAARTAILQVLSHTGMMMPKDVATALERPRGTIRRLLFEMARDGEVRQHGDGAYSAVMTPEEARG